MREESEHVLTRALETVSEAQGRDKRDGVLEADLLTILGSTYRDMGCLQESMYVHTYVYVCTCMYV